MASLSLGVQTQSSAASDAQAENSELMAKVIDAIKALGIEDKDISTHGLSLRPRFNREGETIDAYVATNNVSVIVRNLDQVGEVLDAGFDAGANLAGGVQFSIADPTDSRNQAMELAVADARDRADVLADAAGVTIVGVLSVTEDSGGYPSPRAMSGMAFAESAVMKLATSIEPGELYDQRQGAHRLLYRFLRQAVRETIRVNLGLPGALSHTERRATTTIRRVAIEYGSPSNPP